MDCNNSMVRFSSSFMVHDTIYEYVKWNARLGHIGKDWML